MVNVTPGDKIGSGVHRETFKVEGRTRRIAKLIRAWFTLRLAGMRVRLPGVLLQALSFIRRGTLDINAEECRILQSLPAEIRPYLVKNAVLDSTPDHRSALVVDQLVNYDGTNAQTLKSHGRVANAAFWTHWDKLLALCIKHNLYFYDVF